MPDPTPVTLLSRPVGLDSSEFSSVCGWPFADSYVNRYLSNDIPQRVVFGHGQIWVYCDPNDEIVGFGSLDVCREYGYLTGDKHHPYIPLLAVRPDRQGRGYVRTIVDHLVAQAAVFACYSDIAGFVFLDAYVTNARAIALYQRGELSDHRDRIRPDRGNRIRRNVAPCGYGFQLAFCAPIIGTRWRIGSLSLARSNRRSRFLCRGFERSLFHMLNSEKCEAVIRAVKLGMPMRQVAHLIKVDVSQIKGAIAEDPAFAASVHEARAKCMEGRLKKLEEAAQWQAATFLLESLWPRKFGRNRKPRAKPAPLSAADRAKLERLTEQEKRQLRFLVAKMNGREADATNRDLPDRRVGSSPGRTT